MPKAQKPQSEASVTCPACYRWTAEYVARELRIMAWEESNQQINNYNKEFEKRILPVVKMANKYGGWVNKDRIWMGNYYAVPCPCPLCKGTGRVIPDLCTAYVLAGGNGALTIKAMVALRKAISG